MDQDASTSTHSQGLPQNAHELIDHLRTQGNLNESIHGGLSEREIYRKWNSLTEDERLKVLERGRYTGMLSTEEGLDLANLYQPTSRDNMLGTLQDGLENKRLGFDVEDTNHYVIKFKGDDAVVHSFDLEKPLSAAQIKRVEYISANAGLSNYRYWAANDDAKAALMCEMGFIEYRDGKIIDSWNGKDFTGASLSPHYGNAMKLGRAATKEAMKIIDNIGAPELTEMQKKNIHELADALGLSRKNVKPMSFRDADQGASNPSKDESNCQSCVVAFSARRRGLDCFAKAYDESNPSKEAFQLGERFQDGWLNPKTGKPLQPTILRGRNDGEIIAKLKRILSQPGEYVLGINGKDGEGHVINIINHNGNIVLHDEQAIREANRYRDFDSFMNIDYMELIRIDKAILNIDIIKGVLYH